MLLTWGTGAWAQSEPASSESVSDLKSEVRELQKEIHELKGEVTTIKSQEAIVPPPAPPAKPGTIGETVGTLGKSVEDIRTNLATNLGIQVHGLVDGTYDYNLNHPVTLPNSKGGPNATATGGCLNQLHAFDLDCQSWNLAQFNLHVARVADGGVGSGEADDGIFFFDLAAGQLVGLGDPDDLSHPRERFEVAAVDLTRVAGDADGGALGSREWMGAETQLLNGLADRLDLLRRGLRFHHNQHNGPLKPPV